MKKFLLALVLQGTVLGSYAQDEPFVKSLRHLKYETTILDAAMLFKKDYAQFSPLAEVPTLIAKVESPNRPGKTVKVEAYYLISKERNQLIQLYYANDKLYQKAAYWYFEPGNVAKVEAKYAECLAYFQNDPFFIKVNKGFLESDEKAHETGRSTKFFLDNEKPEDLRGECGYELVSSTDKKSGGFWVYIDGWNIRKLDLDPDLKLPEITSPNVAIEEVKELLIGKED